MTEMRFVKLAVNDKQLLLSSTVEMTKTLKSERWMKTLIEYLLELMSGYKSLKILQSPCLTTAAIVYWLSTDMTIVVANSLGLHIDVSMDLAESMLLAIVREIHMLIRINQLHYCAIIIP